MIESPDMGREPFSEPYNSGGLAKGYPTCGPSVKGVIGWLLIPTDDQFTALSFILLLNLLGDNGQYPVEIEKGKPADLAHMQIKFCY